jgi:hypothetical protein
VIFLTASAANPASSPRARKIIAKVTPEVVGPGAAAGVDDETDMVLHAILEQQDGQRRLHP